MPKEETRSDAGFFRPDYLFISSRNFCAAAL